MTRTPVYVTRLDEVTSELMYVGKATAGSSTSAEVWQIKEINLTGGDVIVKYAGGAGDADSQ